MNIKGLNDKQVADSRKKYGTNQMPQPKLKSAWYFLAEVFKDKLNIILLVMMLLFIGLSALGYGSVYEAIGIGIVLFVVAITTVATKLRTQKSAEELRKKTSLQFANVIRNRNVIRINSDDIVVGDIMLVQAGETICADGYVVDGNISVNNAILNGESDECEKRPVPDDYLYDRNKKITADDFVDESSVFAGTCAMAGTAMVCVARVGTDTENAKIMVSLHEIDEVKTTLQIQLDKLAAGISKIGSVCAIIIFGVLMAVEIMNNGVTMNASLLYTALGSITVALTIFVAAVPEGLPFIIGIITGQNVGRMIKNNILAKNPNKIPEAGNIQLLCTDKTGTLTGGFLQPVHNFTADGTDIGFDDKTGGVAKDIFMQNIAIVNDTTYGKNDEIIGGNLTSRALYTKMRDVKKNIENIKKNTTISQRIVFNSTNKFACAQANTKTDKKTYFMGAPEVILGHAKKYIDADGKAHEINNEKIQEIIKQNAERAMRLVATAVSDSWAENEILPDDLVFVSLVAMRDEVRPGVANVIKEMSKSGIQVMMITGDNLDTARAIAKDCRIIKSAQDIAINAAELDNMSDEDALKTLKNIKVIARATPGTKLRIVKLAQSQGLCIGMCGDGTNDAPALKRADVGFAMGDGTDVCKESGDIIITDNNFISIANCILLGRTFVHNVINFLKFQLPINFTLVILSVLFPLMFGFDAFTAVQILIINIVMDSLNSLAFGGEPPHKSYMTEPAQGKNAPLISKQTLTNIIWNTIGFVCVFALFELPCVKNTFESGAVYMSARFALLVIMAIVNGFCVRTDGYNIFRGLTKNPMFMLVAVGVVGTTILCVSCGGAILQLAPLNITQWLIIFAMALLIIPINFVRMAINKD